MSSTMEFATAAAHGACYGAWLPGSFSEAPMRPKGVCGVALREGG